LWFYALLQLLAGPVIDWGNGFHRFHSDSIHGQHELHPTHFSWSLILSTEIPYKVCSIEASVFFRVELIELFDWMR
jgi:hypothetical protein